MIPGIEPLYQEIAESMLASIPEEWSTATFDVLFFSHSTAFEAEYTRKADGLARSFAPPRNGRRAFQRLRQLFKDAGKPLWGRATFELRPDGQFNIKWGYDNCDAQGNALFDEDEEVRRLEARQHRLSRT
jgi:hypothetical protein